MIVNTLAQCNIQSILGVTVASQLCGLSICSALLIIYMLKLQTSKVGDVPGFYMSPCKGCPAEHVLILGNHDNDKMKAMPTQPPATCHLIRHSFACVKTCSSWAANAERIENKFIQLINMF